MKYTYRDLAFFLLLVAMSVAWFIDRQIQQNRATAVQRQMDRYYWQADKLSSWIRKSEGVSSVDANVDTITIKQADGQSYVFSRTP